MNDDIVKKVVLEKGDLFISTTPGVGKSATRKASLRKVTIKCGICGENDTKVWETYRKSDGHCEQCRRKARAKSMKVTPAEIKDIVERKTSLKIVKFDNDRIYLTCGEHVFDKTWESLRSVPWCLECAKIDPDVRIKVNLAIKNRGILEESEELNELEMPPNYTLVKDEGKHIFIRCPKNHIAKIRRNDDIQCTEHDYTLKGLQQSRSNADIATEIAEYGDTLLSNYVTKKTWLEIQCGGCGDIFYKTFNLYTSKDSKCAKCVKIKAELRENNRRKLAGAEFKKIVQDHGWIWNDDVNIYKDQNTKFKTLCPKKHVQLVCTRDFVNGKRDCFNCAKELKSEKLKLSITDVKERCSNSGFLLLDNTYIGSHHKLKLRCLVCKNIVEMDIPGIKKGICRKCNNTQSAGSICIEKYLESNTDILSFSKEWTFSDYILDDWFSCKDQKLLRFDFRVLFNNGRCLLIEFDGDQHFKPIEFFGGINAFNKRRKHDFTKTLYCEYNNYVLLRIPQIEYNNIEIILDDIINRMLDDRPIMQFIRCINNKQYETFLMEYSDFIPLEILEKN